MRHLTLTTLLTLSAASAACGGFDADPVQNPNPFAPVESGTITTHAEDPRKPQSNSPIASCDIEPLWWSDGSIHRHSTPYFAWTPDSLAIVAGNDAFGSGHAAWNARTGALLYERSSRSIVDGTPSMDRVLTVDYVDGEQQITIEEWATRAPVWRMTQEARVEAVAMNDTADRVATLSCEHDPTSRVGTAVVQIVDVATDSVVHTEEIERRGCSWWTAYGPTVLTFSPDGQHLGAAITEELFGPDRAQIRPIALLISKTDDGYRTTSYTLPHRAEEHRYDAQISAVSFDPSSARLTVIATSGETIHISTEDGAIVETERRGAFAANYDTYLPLMPASPIAWTAAGDVEAMVTVDGSVELRDATGSGFHRLVAPERSDLHDWGFDPAVQNPVMSLAFSPNNDMLAATFRQGMGVWGCPGALDDLRRETQITGLSVDARWSDDAYFAEISVDAHGQPVGYVTGQRIYVDGELVGAQPLGETFRHYTERSNLSITVEVDDGTSTIVSETVQLRRAP